MNDTKLECLIKGYEGTYFEIGQIWKTIDGNKLKVKGFDFKADIYKLTMMEVDDSTEERYYTSKGEYVQENKSDKDLVKLISAELTMSEQKSKTIFEQKAITKYMVFVEGKSNPVKLHNTYESAEEEAKRLSAK